MKDNSQKQTDFDAELKDFQERLKEEWQNTVKESIRVHIGKKAFEKINDIELVFIDSPDKVLPNIHGKEKRVITYNMLGHRLFLTMLQGTFYYLVNAPKFDSVSFIIETQEQLFLDLRKKLLEARKEYRAGKTPNLQIETLPLILGYSKDEYLELNQQLYQNPDIRLLADLLGFQIIFSLLHEIGHFLNERDDDPLLTLEQRELYADEFAYKVMQKEKFPSTFMAEMLRFVSLLENSDIGLARYRLSSLLKRKSDFTGFFSQYNLETFTERAEELELNLKTYYRI